MDFSNCTVLVVDDFATMRRIVVGLLRQAGFRRVAEAEDGAQALRQLQQTRFDLVVSDWNMPNMNGLELLKAVRHSPELQAIPFLLVTAESHKTNTVIVVMTANPQVRTAIATLKAGAYDYLSKSFDLVELRSMVARAMEIRNLRHEVA
jgi:two-component system chemotaxis response regulator CheY